MPKPRRAPDQLNQILEATARVVAERRADNTRLVDVARAADVSIGTLQHYFGSRDELIGAAFSYMNALEAERCGEIMRSSDDPLERLGALLDGMVGEPGEWFLWSEFWAAGARSEVMREQTATVYEAWERLIRETIEQGVALGVFRPQRPAEEIRMLLVTYVDGLAVQVMLRRRDIGEVRAIVGRLAAELLGVPVSRRRP